MAKRRRPTRNAGRQPTTRPAAWVDAPSRRVQVAHSLWNAGNRADALSLFAEAVRQEPNNVRTYVMAARAYAEAFDFEGMERTHEMLIRRASRHPGVHHYVGETYTLLKLPDRAMASFQEAARLPGAGPPTWMELALLHERAHRLDKAEELINRTVREGFDLPLVSLVRGRIQRRQKRPEQAEATFRGLIAKLPAGSEWACQAWSEIALMKDDQGDFAGAVEAIERCKSPQRAHEERHLAASDKLHAQMWEVISTVTRDDFRRWRAEAAELTPRRIALLTGFPRSGTTLLEQMLDAHPDLISSEERDYVGKELLYTLTARRGATPLLEVVNEREIADIVSERRRYLQAMEYLLGEAVGDRLHLDKNPAYNLVIPLMLRLFPETRLIVALRDPRDVVLSCYLRYLPLNSVSVQFLGVKRAADKYALDMSAWLRLRELVEVPWCEIRYEETVADAQGQVRKALATLGLAWDDQILNYRERLSGTKQVTSPSYEAVAQPIYTRAVGRWKHYVKLLEPALSTLEPFIREFGYDT
jgi:tetratricopeptide (TPR) repeat protein